MSKREFSNVSDHAEPLKETYDNKDYDEFDDEQEEYGNETAVFTEEDLVLMTDKFRMLSKISRLVIIKSLFAGEKSVSGIVKSTGLMQANVSKQLKLLQNHGIVDCRPEGLRRYYRIDDPIIYKICKAVCAEDSK